MAKITISRADYEHEFGRMERRFWNALIQDTQVKAFILRAVNEAWEEYSDAIHEEMTNRVPVLTPAYVSRIITECRKSGLTFYSGTETTAALPVIGGTDINNDAEGI
jgi:hypothetical protein